MKIVIPALPSDYARPYPELVLEGTETQMSTLANVLSGLDRSDPSGICLRVSRVAFDAGTWACVTPRLERPLVHRNDPYWVPASLVVWVLDF